MSADGLVMTNHHVGAGALQQLSISQHNYAQDGFYARTRAEELKTPDLELDGLEAITLVMAPDANTVFYGGDPDNFEYPRDDLDICFFRAYENGKPAKIADYLTWSKDGVKEGDPVFVSGNPARTARLDTVAALKTQRNILLPAVLNPPRRREVLLSSWGARLPENARVADNALLGTQNGRKEEAGSLRSLQDPASVADKQARKTVLRTQAAASRAEFARYGLFKNATTLCLN